MGQVSPASSRGVARAREQGFLDIEHIAEIQALYVRGTRWKAGNREELASLYGVTVDDISGAANGRQCVAVEHGKRCPRSGKMASGLCTKHYQRKRANGDPLAVQRRANGTVLEELKRAAHADADECIILSGWESRPVYRYNGESMNAARVVWILATGEDPGGIQVCHTCNGGSGAHGCINIRHLYLGDHKQNAKDRSDAGVGWGERHSHNILTESQVIEIRRLYAAGGITQKELGRRYGTCRSNISLIVRGEGWSRTP